ncbi:MAG TPA: hypothetical protein VE258_01025 [Ktedonobacterales bacterium]|nr:hypothetical protein [Ktedonobacterales bacterium]
MRSWSTFYLALVLALVFAFLGFLYLVPSIYHPFTADTISHTTPHLKAAAAFWLLTVLAIVLGRIVRPSTRS